MITKKTEDKKRIHCYKMTINDNKEDRRQKESACDGGALVMMWKEWEPLAAMSTRCCSFNSKSA